ncbi:scarecrow-like protein 6 [Typha latifolia]|uniref:scarecrow-like protein 6 n=1 Tax=Typha latifolia TaxID=4733 RepID=UPI003C2D44CA
MRGMPCKLQDKGVLQVLKGAGKEEQEAIFWKSSGNKRLKGSQEGLLEPTSVLDKRSPSPPTSSSTLSSSAAFSDNANVAAAAAAIPAPEDGRRDEWAAELQPISAGAGDFAGGVEDWEAMLSDTAAVVAADPGQDQSFLRWIMGDVAGGELGFPGGEFGAASSLPPASLMINPLPMVSSITTSNLKAPNFGIQQSNPCVLYQEPVMEEKPLFLNQSFLLNQIPPNPSFFPSVAQLAPHQEAPPLPNLFSPNPKPHLSPAAAVEPTYKIPPNSPGFFLHIQQKSPADEAVLAHQQQQALVDQLFKAAELTEAGNFVSANGILARLNQQLPSPIGKPLLRSAFYFKEALHLLAANASTPPPPLSSSLDVVLKLSAYKAFSEVSPIVQFTNFTCTQALLEQLGGSNCIHIIDFDIGFGGHWSSFMQELAQQRCTAVSKSSPQLRITAFASPSAHHPLELHLTRENLTQFAHDLDIPFEFNVLSLDPFDPSLLLNLTTGVDQAIAVNLPVSSAICPLVPGLLRLVKQLCPKIVVSVDHGCDRSDLPFSHHFLHAFQSCALLLDSIDSVGTNADATSKIERYLVQPRIESAVLGRHRAVVEKMPPWRMLFASVGFVPVQFSNFTETQAECLLKRVQVRGFHVEKRHASLSLCWQRGDLVSVSAWRC